MKRLLLLCALLQIALIGCVVDGNVTTETTATTTTTTTTTVTNGSTSVTTTTSLTSTVRGRVENLTVTEFTTSSVSLNWTAPAENTFNYTVQWSGEEINGTKTTDATSINITNLIAGVNYSITVTAVGVNGQVEGGSHTIHQYTKPEVVRNLTVTDVTTSSVSLNWTEPVGKRSFFIVQLTGGNANETYNVTETNRNITNLTAGVKYEICVTAVAGDNYTKGDKKTVSKYTKPGKIINKNVTTTNVSISLKWTPPSGEVSRYRVDWHNGGTVMNMITPFPSASLLGLVPGTTYTITITAINENNDTGVPYTFTSVTEPAVVSNLTVFDVTTSSLYLSWTEPVGKRSFFIVQLTGGNVTETYNVTETNRNITNLTAGVKYEISVTAVADDNYTKGEYATVSKYTRPEKPVEIKIPARGTNYLTISWILPNGIVEYYVVNISNEELGRMYSNTTTDTTARFTGLHPGRMFNITVISVAGNFRESSTNSFATVPTPPGSIIIIQRTNSSLHLQWETPVLMEGAPHLSYIIIYQDKGGKEQNRTVAVNNTVLPQLSSGTFYNISVQTVGPEDLKSTIVYSSSFTLPNPVVNLVARAKSNTSIEVNWEYPHGVQQHYNYSVQINNQTGDQYLKLVSNNNSDIPNLEPGTRYNITVTTIAAPGTKSTEEHTFSYTMPNAVTGLSMEDVNTTAIRLTWQRPSDYKPSYSYLVKVLLDNMDIQTATTQNETYTFYNLSSGQLYNFAVFTVVEGVRSTMETYKSYTIPEVVSDILAVGSTTNMSVSWTLAVGQVESYTVLLYRDNQQVTSNMNLTKSTTSAVFTRLKPGVLYCVFVVTKSGPRENNSSRVCNATFPNPPGPITVVSKTVNSITFTWPLPEDMDRNLSSFRVSNFRGSNLTKNNSFLLEGLQSGSNYSITVVTVGVKNYESTAVTASNYTTPYRVSNLTQTEITNNSVTLVWEQQDSKSDYKYKVKASNGSLVESKTSSDKTETITGLLSGSNYSFTVTTIAADGTEAAPVTVSYFTRPFSIRHLEAKTLNTTAVNLTWVKPLEYKDEYTFSVQTTSCGSQNKSLKELAAQFSGLIAGTECSFCVIVKAADGIEGQEECILQYTKPEAVQPIVTNEGSNSSIRVSWAKPPGRVESYKIDLTGTSTTVVNSTTTSLLFESLSAGRLYTVVVFTRSGPFNASSEYVTNATLPNPPGLIEILTKTTGSIVIKWEGAPLMTDASFRYRLTAVRHQGGNITTVYTNNTDYTFESLLSGTPYNIYVATVGPMVFESEAVQIHMVTTKPFSVKSLTASTQETKINLTWNFPDENKESYRYNVSWQSSDESLSNSGITQHGQYDINNLVPGNRYNFTVTTETSDGTKAAPIWNSTCTTASQVKDIKCQGPNTEVAQLLLNWTNPSGKHSGFQVTVTKDNEIIYQTDNISRPYHVVSNLNHFTDYELTVKTLSCGPPSTPVLCSSKTGITNPPIPDNFETLSLVSERLYNKFFVRIVDSLLNSTNGPVKYVGVLVTNNPPDSTADFKSYLRNTYTEWKAKQTPVYLATVKENPFQARSEKSYLDIEVGSEIKWNGYTNGPLDANGKYHYAIVLFTQLNLSGERVDVQNSLVSITNFYVTVVELPQNPVYTTIAIGATLGIFFLLFIVLIGFIIYWKRLSNKEAPDIQIQSMRAKVSVAVRVEDYEDYYRKHKADSNCGFAEEFEDLKLVGTGQSKTSALTLENKPKNRYNNVLPYDSSRVKLSIIHGSPYDDYINANYMPGCNSRKEFIAAQGPLPGTVNEFWRMIWEKNVQTLVMLTRCNEQGRVKCEQYWNSSTKHFDNITVTMTSEIPLDDWTIREFDIKNVKTAETRSVRHFHFTAWPDHGVPQTTELLISFRHLVREHMDQYSRNSPTVVHCSAGVGRTGTFIAIDRLIFQIERENIVDVYGIVHDLRMHRPLMVQTEDQYVFLNQCALDIIRSRTGTNVDLIYQNTAALSIYENIEPKRGYHKNGYHNA